MNGPAHSVRRQIEHRETLPCPKCAKAEEEGRYMAHCEQCALENAEMGLPQLTGTTAQIAFAEKIRRQGALDATRRVIDEQACIDILSLATEAKWWIEGDKRPGIPDWTKMATTDFGA